MLSAMARPVMFGRKPPMRGLGMVRPKIWTPSITDGLITNFPFRENATGQYSLEALTTETVDADGTYQDWESGLIKSATANKARITPDGVLIEETSTNLFTYSATFDNSIWSSARGTLTAAQTTGPDGTTSGWLLARTDSSNRYLRNPYDLNGAVVSLSMIVKKKDYDTINLYGNSGLVIRTWTFSTETFSGATGTATTGFKTLPGGWYLLGMSYTGHADSKHHGIELEDNASANVYVYAQQLEAFSSPSSYIPTTTGSVQRAKDVLKIDNTGGVHCPAAAGTFFCAVTPNFTGQPVAHKQIIDVYANNNGIMLFYLALNSNGGKPTVQFFAGGTQVADLTATDAAVAGMTRVYTVAWGANDFRLYTDGSDEQEDTSGPAPSEANTNMSLGQSRAGAFTADATLGHVLTYNRALPAGEVAQVVADIQRMRAA